MKKLLLPIVAIVAFSVSSCEKKAEAQPEAQQEQPAVEEVVEEAVVAPVDSVSNAQDSAVVVEETVEAEAAHAH